jgi:hypothetical protein
MVVVGMMIMTSMALGAAPSSPQFEALREKPAETLAALSPLDGAGDRAAWEQQRGALRAAWEDVIGPMPPAHQRVPLNVKTLGTETFDDHTRVLLSYDVDAKTRVEAYLLLPKGAADAPPRPAMVCLHPTSKATIRTVVGLDGRETVHYAMQTYPRRTSCSA